MPTQCDPITSAVFTDLSSLGLISVTGNDAEKFLQGQLTCDLRTITATQSHLAAHCNPQGRMISLFRILHFQDAYYLQMPRDLLPLAMAALQKYAVFFKVSVLDASEKLFCVGYAGPHLQKIVNPLPQQIDEAVTSANKIVIRLPGTTPRYAVFGNPDSLTEFWQQLSELGKAIPFQEWQCLDIAAGVPTLYAETSAKFMPHELNLPQLGGVSFEKGCYTGQEIVARIHYRGNLKQQLCLAKMTSVSTPLRGADIHTAAGDPCGTIVDFCLDKNNYYHLLILIKTAHAAEAIFLDTTKSQPLELIC